MYKMENRSLLVVSILLFMVCVLSFTLDNYAFAGKKLAEGQVQTIILKQEPAGISPNLLNVKLGTTIVWFNNDPEPVTIKFIDKLGIACKAPVNFYADLFGYYETGTIPQGGTASICFIYKGDYKYEVKRIVSKEKGESTEQISTGKIIAVE